MSFPTSPTEGQRSDEYIYNSTLGAWEVSDDLIVESIRAENHPSFSGIGPTTHTVYSSTPQKIEAIKHNIGGHFNTSTGEFTCPVDGKYIGFSNHLVGTGSVVSGHGWAHFQVNGVDKGNRSHSSHGFARVYEPLSLHTVMTCVAGDKIRCILFTGTSSYMHGNYSTLSICLIG